MTVEDIVEEEKNQTGSEMMDHKPWYEMKQPEDNKAGYPITNRGYHRRQAKKDPTALLGIGLLQAKIIAEHEATKAQLKFAMDFIEILYREPGNRLTDDEYIKDFLGGLQKLQGASKTEPDDKSFISHG